MENKKKELNLYELEKVNGGIVNPFYPDEHDDDNSNNNSGGATGGW